MRRGHGRPGAGDGASEPEIDASEPETDALEPEMDALEPEMDASERRPYLQIVAEFLHYADDAVEQAVRRAGILRHRLQNLGLGEAGLDVARRRPDGPPGRTARAALRHGPVCRRTSTNVRARAA